MKKQIIILFLALQILISCSSTPALLYIHKTEKNDGDIFGYPKNGFFISKSYSQEITQYKIKFNKEEYKEIKKLIEILKSKQDLDDLELGEGPTDTALIIGKDTLYGYGQSWIWKKKVTYFESPILKNALDKY